MLNRLVLLMVASLIGMDVWADDAPQVEASVYCETFDAISDVGGNDGVFSSCSSNDYPLLYDNPTFCSSTQIKSGAQCIRLGNSRKIESQFSLNNIPFSGNGRIVFRGGAWNTSKSMQLKVSANGNSQTFTFQKSSMDDYSMDLSEISTPLNVNFSNTIDSKNNSYVFLDDVTLFKDIDVRNDAATELQLARKIILSGTFNEADMVKINSLLKENNVLVSIHTENAHFPENTILNIGNPNALIYGATGNGIINTENVVENGSCENLKLYDGDSKTSYPFYSDESFVAVNVSYDRTFTVGSAYYSTVYLPFTVQASMNLSYLASLMTYDTNTAELLFCQKEEVQSNEPCIICVTKAQPFKDLKNVNVTVEKSTSLVNPYEQNTNKNLSMDTFEGVYAPHSDIVSSASNGTISRFGLSGGKILKVSSEGGFFKPFRAFISILNIQIPSGELPSIAFDFPTKVSPVIKEEEVAKVYGLDGRQYDFQTNGSYKKGIYVVGNKKMYLK